MDKQDINRLIDRYETVYLFATNNLSTIIAEQVLQDLSLEQFGILRHLYIHSQLRSTDLAKIGGVNKSAITSKVERLANRGLIERVRDQQDRRNVYLRLTSEGETIYLQGKEKIVEFVSAYLKELTEEELHTFLSIYEKINIIIENKTRGGK